MGGGNQLDAALGDGAGGGGLLLRSHFIDDDDLGHMIFHGLDHYSVLAGRRGDLHSAGVADGRMRHIPIAGDFVGSVDDYHPFAGLVGQDPGHFPQHRGFAHAGPAQQQDVFVGQGQVFDDFDGAGYSAPGPAGNAHHLPLAVADGGNAMQGALHSGPVVIAEIAHLPHQIVQVVPADFPVIQNYISGGKAGLRNAAQIQHYLEEFRQVLRVPQAFLDPLRQHFQQPLQFPLGQFMRYCQLLRLHRGHPVAARRGGRQLNQHSILGLFPKPLPD